MHRTVRRSLTLLLAAAIALATAPAAADDDGEQPDEHTVYTLGGGEFWLGDLTGGHGVLLAHWRFDPAESPVQLDVDFNTDTLRVQLSGLALTDRLSVFAEGAAEYPYALILPDYYRRGERIAQRGFWAGYGELAGGLAWSDAPHFLRLRFSGRRWLFDTTSSTADDLRLPPETWVGSTRLNYTFWNVSPDRSQWEPHQPFMRITGFAAGLTVGADLRSDDGAWGGLADGSEVDVRVNTPDNPIVTVRQWARAGFRLAGPVRLQLAEAAGWGRGEDDLTRDRLGGMNPYVVPIAGLPWAGLVSGRYAAGRAEIRLAGPVDHEIGLFADGAFVADIRRTGDLDTYTPTGGVGFLADVRHRAWKADVRVGTVLDGDWLLERPTLSAWLSVGRVW